MYVILDIQYPIPSPHLIERRQIDIRLHMRRHMMLGATWTGVKIDVSCHKTDVDLR